MNPIMSSVVSEPILDFLGFNIDTFLNEARAGGYSHSSRFPHLNASDLATLYEYMDKRGLKLRLQYWDTSLAVLQYPSCLHHALKVYFIWIIGNFTFNRITPDMPILIGGSAPLFLDGHESQPT